MTIHLSYQSLAEARKGFTKLFLEYAAETPERNALIEKFFTGDYRRKDDVARRLSIIDSTDYKRADLIDLLKQQNRAFGCSEKTIERINALLSANSAAIVTGQQVGILTGSLYTIYKTLSAIALAEKLKRDFPDREFVPVFWLEGEDHDYDEVASIATFAENKVKSFRYAEKTYTERSMVGRTVLSQDAAHFLNDFLTSLQPSDFKSWLSELLRSTYKEGETFLTAFAKLMTKLFEQDGLVFINSDDAAFKKLCSNIFIKELHDAPKSSELVVAQSAALEELGYEAQAKARPVNLYMIENGQRLRIETGDKNEFVLYPTRRSVSQNDLIELAERKPEQFGANVILRPILQDKVLPTLAYVAGPAEVAYLAQLKTVYQFFGVSMPLVVTRKSLSLVEAKVKKVFVKIAEATGNDAENLTAVYMAFFAGKEKLIQKVLSVGAKINIEKVFAEAQERATQLMTDLADALAQLDPTLKDAAETASEKMLYQIQHLKEKALRAEKQKGQEIITQIDKCSVNLLPDDTMQERVVNVCYFLNKYGINLLQTLKKNIQESSEEKHIVVEL